MITTKQRSELKRYAQNLKPAFNIGKDNLTENLISAIDNYVNKNEIAKIKILQNSSSDVKTTMQELCDKLLLDPVLCIGKMVIVYRYSKNCKKHVLVD